MRSSRSWRRTRPHSALRTSATRRHRSRRPPATATSGCATKATLRPISTNGRTPSRPRARRGTRCSSTSSTKKKGRGRSSPARSSSGSRRAASCKRGGKKLHRLRFRPISVVAIRDRDEAAVAAVAFDAADDGGVACDRRLVELGGGYERIVLRGENQRG